jgi:type IV pilus assembly protein PilE
VAYFRDHRRGSPSGFSLLELMVVVVIVGALMMIAVPAYQQSVVKGNRSAAQSYLLDLAQMQQQLFNDSRNFAANETGLRMTEPAQVSPHYTVVFELSTTPPAFTINATPIIGSQQAGDGILSITNTGQKFRGTEPW